MNNRAKGLSWCREVRDILKEKGYKVEGPGMGIIFVDGKTIPMHKDYFNCLDLLSYRDGVIRGHQVTDLSNKASHKHKMEDSGVVGWLWCRGKKGNRVEWRVFDGDMELDIDKL